MTEEQLPFGTKYRGRMRTITEGEFAAAHNLMWITHSLHSDIQYVKNETPFKERVMAGQILMGITMGLVHTSDFFPSLKRNNVRLLAILGFENVRFITPVHPGDTIYVESEILDTRPTSKHTQSIMRCKDIVYKSTGEVAAELIRVHMYYPGVKDKA
jgi:acyl dehydratase